MALTREQRLRAIRLLAEFATPVNVAKELGDVPIDQIQVLNPDCGANLPPDDLALWKTVRDDVLSGRKKPLGSNPNTIMAILSHWLMFFHNNNDVRNTMLVIQQIEASSAMKSAPTQEAKPEAIEWEVQEPIPVLTSEPDV